MNLKINSPSLFSLKNNDECQINEDNTSNSSYSSENNKFINSEKIKLTKETSSSSSASSSSTPPNNNNKKLKLNFSVERLLSSDTIKSNNSPKCDTNSSSVCQSHCNPFTSCSDCLTNSVKYWKIDSGTTNVNLPFHMKSIYRPIPRYARTPHSGNLK